MKVLILVIVKVLATLMIKYKFYDNFGEIYSDFSNNNRRAVNGISSLDLLKNVVATDRGIYYKNNDATVSLPPNELVSEFSMLADTTIAFWVLAEDYSYYCYYCKSETKIVYIRRYSASSKLGFFYSDKLNGNTEIVTALNTFIAGTWYLIFTTFKDSIKLYLNKSLLISYSLTSPFSMTDLIGCNLGLKDSQVSYKGYIWSFELFDSVEQISSFISDTSSNCLVAGCSTCESSVVIGNITGCIPNQMIKTNSPSGSDCSKCSEGCNSNLCLSCELCEISSCTTIDSQILCVCPDEATPTENSCLCPDSYFFNGTHCLPCLPECLKCSSSSSCLLCKSQNSHLVSNGCKCDDGFYNLTSISELNSCLQCDEKCSKCSEPETCTECKFSGALLELNCECKSGYFKSNKKCQVCFPECLECASYGPCLSCKSTFSQITTLGCECLDGYGGPNSLLSEDSCVKCHDDCLKCNELGNCISCKDENKIPSDIGCKCKDGYYLDVNCTRCTKNCKECNSTDCLKCFDTLAVAQNNECICPEATYTKSSDPLECGLCRSDCKTCSDSNTCLECLVEGAKIVKIGCSCETGYYEKDGKCKECLTWNSEKGICEFCNNGEYFFSGKCLDCPELCTECDSNACITCVENAILVNNLCKCLSDYDGKIKCELKLFYADIKLDSDYNLLLTLSLEPQNLLNPSNIKIDCDKYQIKSELKAFNSKSYKIIMIYPSKLYSKINVRLVISENIVSKFNSSLTQNEYFLEIVKSDANKVSQSTKTYIQAGQTSFYLVASVSFFVSIFSFNFVSFWNFLNSIQFLVYLRLIDIKLPEKIDALIKALRQVTRVFNVFDYLISSSEFITLNGKYYEFGFENYSIFDNVGHWITMLMIIISNNLLVNIYMILFKNRCKLNFLTNLMTKIAKNFKFNAYIRFFIQSYLDIGIACIIGVQFIHNQTIFELISYILCTIFILIIILTPVISIIFMNKHKDEISQGDSNILEKYGSLFYELSKDHGLLASFFYFFFFLKRLFFIIILFSLPSYPLFQLLLAFILNVSVFSI